MKSMSINNTVRMYAFEVIERIVRFNVHLRNIEDQFYHLKATEENQQEIFLTSYKECLGKLLTCVSIIVNDSEKNRKDSIENLGLIMHCLINLHKELGHLPRPSIPTELKRFIRIIEKQIKNTKESEKDIPNISLFISEIVSEQVYATDPLEKYKSEILNPFLDSFDTSFYRGTSEGAHKIKYGDNFHITIPRIDIKNPCKWGSLIHEVAHKLMDKFEFDEKSIYFDFESMFNQRIKNEVSELSKVIHIKSWLIECWCDLFACIILGPSLWFSQYQSFLISLRLTNTLNDIKNSEYPPNIFRLKLIESLLSHRFKDCQFEEVKVMQDSCGGLIAELENINAGNALDDSDIRRTYLLFRHYFLKYFFPGDDDKHIKIAKERIDPILKYTESINQENILSLLKLISEGLPFPSIAINSNRFNEKPSTVQEILLTAWLYRNGRFCEKVLKIVEANNATECEEELFDAFDRFDQSILRSIQVGEWFHLFEDPKSSFQPPTVESSKTSAAYGVLSDKEILELIGNESIKIIPIISLSTQLGSTSFDIRLGTSFQIFQQSKLGVVDFAKNSHLKSSFETSQLIDLDFKESITIMPGQFLLGHSMEYIKLPDNLAAQVEGRSSFARLGLQIHMTASFVDPGFEGVLTFEILNSGINPIALYPGYRIAQLRFFPIQKPEKTYRHWHKAKYGGLLKQNDSLQFKDIEVVKLKEFH